MPPPGAAAAGIDGGHCAIVRQDHRDPGARPGVLGPTDVFAPGHGLWQLDIEDPARRVGLRLADGPELWVSVTPKPGDSTKFDLVPGVYAFEETYEDGYKEEKQFTIKPGTIHRFEARAGRVTLVEVSTTQLDDVVRLQDDYGRSGGR